MLCRAVLRCAGDACCDGAGLWRARCNAACWACVGEGWMREQRSEGGRARFADAGKRAESSINHRPVLTPHPRPITRLPHNCCSRCEPCRLTCPTPKALLIHCQQEHPGSPRIEALQAARWVLGGGGRTAAVAGRRRLAPGTGTGPCSVPGRPPWGPLVWQLFLAVAAFQPCRCGG